MKTILPFHFRETAQWLTVSLAAITTLICSAILPAGASAAGVIQKQAVSPNRPPQFFSVAAIISDNNNDGHGDLGDSVWTSMFYYPIQAGSTARPTTGSAVILKQCDGLGHNCGVISSKGTFSYDAQQNVYGATTSTKPYEFK